MDACACSVGFAHAARKKSNDNDDTNSSPPNIVTARVERIDMLNRSIDLHQDLRMSAAVQWVGNASLMVACDLSQQGTTLATSQFWLVTVDKKTGRPTPCNPLLPDVHLNTESARHAFAAAELANELQRAERKEKKKAKSQFARELKLLGLDENSDAIAEMESLRKASVIRNEVPAVKMSKTLRTATHLVQPQDANPSGKVFGGWLLQRSFEIAWVSAFEFLSSTGHGICRPQLLSLDDVEFLFPVNVGSIVSLFATVSFVDTASGVVEVSVSCEVRDPTTSDAQLTNTFEYIFGPSERLPGTVKPVVCDTMDIRQWSMHVRGRRVVEDAIALARKKNSISVDSNNRMRILELLK